MDHPLATSNKDGRNSTNTTSSTLLPFRPAFPSKSTKDTTTTPAHQNTIIPPNTRTTTSIIDLHSSGIADLSRALPPSPSTTAHNPLTMTSTPLPPNPFFRCPFSSSLSDTESRTLLPKKPLSAYEKKVQERYLRDQRLIAATFYPSEPENRRLLREEELRRRRGWEEHRRKVEETKMDVDD